MLIISTFY